MGREEETPPRHLDLHANVGGARDAHFAFNRRTMRRIRRNDGARSAARVSGCWIWDVLDGMKSGGSSFFGSISNLTKTKALHGKLEAAESPVRDARDATGRTQSHFQRHTSGRRSNVMPRLSRACTPIAVHTVPLGSYIWISLERLQPVGATSVPPSCTGAQIPAWSNLIRTCANNQCAPPSTRQPFCVCVQRAHAPSRRHLRPAGGRFFSVSRAERESPRERSE